jgi:hypothetical protein
MAYQTFNELANDNCLIKELSPIKIINRKLFIPYNDYEDFFVDFFDENNIDVYEYNNDYYCKISINDKIIARNGSTTIFELDDLLAIKFSKYNAEFWYNGIPDKITFKSYFIPVNKTQFGELDAEKSCMDLEQKLDIFFGEHKDTFFLRTNSCSPKDLNEDLKVNSGKEVIKKIVASSRVMNSLRTITGDKYIMLREYQENLPYKNEFRCFVCNDKLRAISQYHYDIYIDEFQNKEKQTEILERITKFFKLINGFIPYHSYVFDVVIWDDNKVNSYNECGLFLIEINCFGGESPCGASLFNWIRDYDILYNSDETVLRVCTEKSDIQELEEMVDKELN